MKNLFKLMIVSLYFVSIGVLAHADLVSTNPSEGAELDASPQMLSLEFSDAVHLTQLMLHAADGSMVATDFEMTHESSKSFSATVQEELNAGVYTIYWVAMGEDSHKMTGDFTFEVKQ